MRLPQQWTITTAYLAKNKIQIFWRVKVIPSDSNYAVCVFANDAPEMYAYLSKLVFQKKLQNVSGNVSDDVKICFEFSWFTFSEFTSTNKAWRHQLAQIPVKKVKIKPRKIMCTRAENFP